MISRRGAIVFVLKREMNNTQKNQNSKKFFKISPPYFNENQNFLLKHFELISQLSSMKRDRLNSTCSCNNPIIVSVSFNYRSDEMSKIQKQCLFCGAIVAKK